MTTAPLPPSPAPSRRDATPDHSPLAAASEAGLAAAVFDYSPDAIIVVDRLGRIANANPAAHKLFGFDGVGLVGSMLEDLMPAGSRAAHGRHRDGFFLHPTPREMGSGLPLRAIRRNGVEFPVDVMLNRLTLGGETFAIAVVRDMTDRHRAAEVLAEAEREKARLAERERNAVAVAKAHRTLSGIIEASPAAVIMIDGSDRIAVWNPEAERLYQLSADAAVGRPWREVSALFPAIDSPTTETALERVRQDGGFRGLEVRRRRRDGTIFALSASGAVVPGDAGEQSSILIIANDITAQRALEDQLRQAQRVEAIGQLTGGVAHDFNNILAIVQGNLELIQEQAADQPELIELLADALGAAERGASLTHRLLAYSRQQQLAPRIVNIRPLLQNLVGVLRRVIEANVVIETSAIPCLWNARIDPHQLENALINLAVNSRDAMPRGGKLTIAAENAVLDEHCASAYLDIAPGHYVLISVSDTGVGMDKATAAKALEPFFTTKPIGQGTGLGLSMVFGFVKQSGGHVKLYSEPGHGTTVKLFLPRELTGEAELAGQPEPAVVRGSAAFRVLVVEDEESVRRLQVRLLNQLGYRTLEAEDGRAALALVETSPDIQVLLTDVMLPHGVSGPDLAVSVREKIPSIKVIFMSGYAPNAVLRAEDFKGAPVLSKPFSRAVLAETMQGVLADRGEGA